MLVWERGLLEKTAKYITSTSTEKYTLNVHVVKKSTLIN